MQKNDSSAPFDATCPFCAIVVGKEAAQIVARWEDSIAFAPLHPATRGHTLVIPTAHVATAWDLDLRLAQRLIGRVLEVATTLRTALDPEGMNIIQSNGAAATQTVPHVHVHVVPRYKDDNMGNIWPKGSSVSKDETTRITREVSEALARQSSQQDRK